MNWRLVLIIITLLGLLVGIYFLDGLLQQSAWAENNSGSWSITAKGWSILPAAWPATLGGLMIGGVMILFLFGYAYRTAEYADHSEEIEYYKKEISQANHRAEQAENKAEAQYQKQLKASEQREYRAWQQQQEAETIRERALTQERQAKELIHQEKIKTKRAETKCNNATAGFARKSKKLRGNRV